MPRHNGAFTPREKVFIGHMADTGNVAYAGYKAGYSQPEDQARKVMLRPAVQEAVKAAQAKRLENEALPLAVSLVINFMKDEKINPKIRLDAAKTALSYTMGRNSEGADKAPEDMTGAEITARIEMLRAQRDQLLDALPDAEIIDNEPAQEGGIFG